MEQVSFPEIRPWLAASARGFRLRCPDCGTGALMQSYGVVVRHCAGCGTELHHHRADDAPPYFTIMIVGHTIIPLLVLAEKLWHPELWIHFVIWLPLTFALTLWLLPRVKGSVVGLQWAMRMHGFSATNTPAPRA